MIVKKVGATPYSELTFTVAPKTPTPPQTKNRDNWA